MNTMIASYWREVPETYTGIVFSPEKDKHWFVNGKRHREDGPASEFINGDKEWYKEGKLHREDSPAGEYTDGTKYWYKNGHLHREDGPAREYSHGYKEWRKNGKLHRDDGPAIEYPNGTKYWYLEGKEYSKINLKNHVILDHYKGKYGIMWYRFLDKDEILEYPDIPGLITK